MHFFTNSYTRLSAVLLLFCVNGFLIELFEVVIHDKPLVQIKSFLFMHEDRSIIERDNPFSNSCEIYTKSAAGIKTRVEAVFSGCFHIFGSHFLFISVMKPFIGYIAITKILINPCATVNNSNNTMLLQELGSEPSTTCPAIYGRKLPHFYWC